MITRAVMLTAVILGAGMFTARAAGPETPVNRPALASLPRTLGAWSAPVDAPLAKDAIAVLGVDDYLSRTYVNAASRQPVHLYVGYYGSQRQGDSIHSPQNCLPGAGWQAVEGERRPIDLGGGAVTVNRYLIEKGLDRQLVLYWYQGRGRIVANEYANKFWLMIDAARLHRSNGALVRVITPIGRGEQPQAAAEAALTEFTRSLFPHLNTYLP